MEVMNIYKASKMCTPNLVFDLEGGKAGGIWNTHLHNNSMEGWNLKLLIQWTNH